MKNIIDPLYTVLFGLFCILGCNTYSNAQDAPNPPTEITNISESDSISSLIQVEDSNMSDSLEGIDQTQQQEVYYIQLGAFSTEKNANRFNTMLNMNQITDARIHKEHSKTKVWYKVIIEPFNSQEEADQRLVDIKAKSFEGFIKSIE